MTTLDAERIASIVRANYVVTRGRRGFLAGPGSQVRGANRALLFERPVSTEWAAVAGARGQVVVTMGPDGYDGRDAELERYLARAARLRMALVPVDPGAPNDGGEGR